MGVLESLGLSNWRDQLYKKVYGEQTAPPPTAPRMYAPAAKEPPPKSDEGRGALIGHGVPLTATEHQLAKIRGSGRLDNDYTPYDVATAASGGLGAGAKAAALNVGMDAGFNPIKMGWDALMNGPVSPMGAVRNVDAAMQHAVDAAGDLRSNLGMSKIGPRIAPSIERTLAGLYGKYGKEYVDKAVVGGGDGAESFGQMAGAVVLLKRRNPKTGAVVEETIAQAAKRIGLTPLEVKKALGNGGWHGLPDMAPPSGTPYIDAIERGEISTGKSSRLAKGETDTPLLDEITARNGKEDFLLDKVIQTSERQRQVQAADRAERQAMADAAMEAEIAAGRMPAGTKAKRVPLDKPTREQMSAAQGTLLRSHNIYLDDTPKIDKTLGTLLQKPAVSASAARLLRDRIVHDTMPTLEYATGDKQYKRVHPMEISTRQPSSKEYVGEDPVLDMLVTSYENMKKGASFGKNIETMLTYPQFKSLRGLPTDVIAEKMIDHMVSNLIHVYDKVDPEHRERSSLWYDGARRILDDWSKQYGVTDAQVAGVIAGFSPQKDWYMNVDMGKRLLDFWGNRGQQAWDQRMDTVGYDKVLKAKAEQDKLDAKEAEEKGEVFVPNDKLQTAYAQIQGKSFAELTDPYQKAVWFRLYDEGLNPRTHRIVTPEGDFGGPVMKKDGKTPAGMAWGSYNTIQNAMSILEDGSLANISKTMGKEHKIRNFYNNMLVPINAENDPVTADTHHVAVDLLSPLSGGDEAVQHNFGGASSNVTGESGTYGIHAEAVRRAAKIKGITGRQMQSITWEAVRGLFTDDFKRNKANTSTIERIWHAYSDGKIGLNEARKYIFDVAGGIDAPTWANTPAVTPVEYFRQRGGGLPGRRNDAVASPVGVPAGPQELPGSNLPGTDPGPPQAVAPGTGSPAAAAIPMGQPAGKQGPLPGSSPLIEEGLIAKPRRRGKTSLLKP